MRGGVLNHYKNERDTGIMPKRGKKKGRGDSSSSSSDTADPAAPKGCASSQGAGVRCNKCQAFGHLSKDCLVKKQQREERAKCWVCGSLGHTRRNCPGVDGESWCSKNKGKSAPPKGEKEGHRAQALASMSGKKGRQQDDEIEMLETSDLSPWIDGYTQLHLVLAQDRSGHKAPATHSGLRDFFASHLSHEEELFCAHFRGCVAQIEPDVPPDPELCLARRSVADFTSVLEDTSVLATFVGIQPKHAPGWNAAIDESIMSALENAKAFALGASGLDLLGIGGASEIDDALARQVPSFRGHLGIASRTGRPIGLLLRAPPERREEAEDLFIHVIADAASKACVLVLLNFQASPSVPLRLRALGFVVVVGISPAITFSKLQRDLGETVFDTPLDQLWVSSDSPVTVVAGKDGGGGQVRKRRRRRWRSFICD